MHSLHLNGHDPDIQRLHARAVPIVPNVFLALLFAISVARGRRVGDVFLLVSQSAAFLAPPRI